MKIKIIICFLLLYSCGENNIDLEIEKSNKYRIEKEFAKAITILKGLEKKYAKSNDLEKVNFLLGEIYLNDIKDYNYAIEEFKKVSTDPNLYAKSTFMIGYIYSNNLNEYSMAIEYYKKFIDNFQGHDLYPSVEYELEQLSQFEKVIDSLNVIAKTKLGD